MQSKYPEYLTKVFQFTVLLFLGVYLTVSMSVTSFSVILTVIVLKLHHCGPHQVPVPALLRCLVLKWLARIVRCNCHTKPHTRPSPPKRWAHNSRVYDESSDVSLRLVNDCNSRQHSPIAEIRAVNRFRPAEPHMNNTSYSRDYFREIKEQKDTVIMEEILRCLRILVSKRDEDDNEADVVNEWRQVALVLDRFLFCVFMISTLISTFIVMVVYPLQGDVNSVETL